MQVIVDRIDEEMVVMRVLPHRNEAILISTTLIPGLEVGAFLEVDIRQMRTPSRPVVRPDTTAFLRELRKKL